MYVGAYAFVRFVSRDDGRDGGGVDASSRARFMRCGTDARASRNARTNELARRIFSRCEHVFEKIETFASFVVVGNFDYKITSRARSVHPSPMREYIRESLFILLLLFIFFIPLFLLGALLRSFVFVFGPRLAVARPLRLYDPGAPETAFRTLLNASFVGRLK